MNPTSEAIAPAITARSLWRLHPASLIATAAILPMMLISLLGWHYGYLLRPILSGELTSWEATRRVLSTLLNPTMHADSWLPMQHALQVLKGPNRNALYETLFFQDHERFQYPPSSLLPLDLLSHVGLLRIRLLNLFNSLIFILNAAAMAYLAQLLFRRRAIPEKSEVGPPILPGATQMSVLAAGLAFLFYPLARALILGQIQLWIDLLFTAALILWNRDRRLAAGVLIGVACTIKPQLGLLLIWGLLWRESGFVVGFLLGSMPLGALSLLRYGIHNHLAYLRVLSFLSRRGESFFANNSVNGILNWYLSPDDCLFWNHGIFAPYITTVHAGTVAATLFFFAIIVLQPLLLRHRRPGLADLGVAAICTVVSSPVAWEHHYGILFPLFLIALYELLTQPGRTHRLLSMGLLLVSWILVADFIPFASLLVRTPFVFLQAYCFFGALVLLGLLLATRPGGQIPAVRPLSV